VLIDCDRCEVRDIACGDCVIGVLLRTPEEDRPVPYLPVDMEPDRREEPLELAEPERRALEVLADQGLIPRLRLVQRMDPPPAERAAG
jgi:hypothetical protein